MRRGSVADAMLLVTVCLWALNFTVSKYILDHGFRPLTYSGIRYAIAALIFLAIVLPVERSLRIQRRDLLLVGGAIVLLFLNQLGFVFALDLTTATTVALLFGTLPIFTALIARLVGMERLSRRFWLAAALSFGGVVLVTVGSGRSVSGNVWGDLLALDERGDVGRILGRARPAHAALLALPPERDLPRRRQRRAARRRDAAARRPELRPLRASSGSPSCTRWSARS